MVNLSKKDLTIIAGVLGAIDFAYEGALTKPVSRAVKRALRGGAARLFLNPGQIPTNTQLAKGIGRSIGRQALRVPGTALAVGRTIALRHPILTAGAIAYYTIKNRDEIEDIIREGYEVVSDVELPGAQRRRDFAADPIGFVQDVRSEMTPGVGPFGLFRPLPSRVPKIRRKSTYNTAVSKAMKAIKKSTSYGKKGVLNAPKKAFGFVAKTVSKLRRGKKVSSKGASGVVKRALPGISKIEVRK